ncbi:MAG: hypothetical protein ACLVFT_00010 [Megasphaera lornae]
MKRIGRVATGFGGGYCYGPVNALSRKKPAIFTSNRWMVMPIRFRRDGVLTTAAMLPGDKGENNGAFKNFSRAGYCE